MTHEEFCGSNIQPLGVGNYIRSMVLPRPVDNTELMGTEGQGPTLDTSCGPNSDKGGMALDVLKKYMRGL